MERCQIQNSELLVRSSLLSDGLTWCIGPPLRTSLRKLLGTDDLVDKALSLYRERFADIGIFENELLRRNCYSRPRSVARQLYAFRNPPAWASSSEQNQRSGLVG